ncbi:hypothetical protein [Streptomyces sp. AC1-42T]|uniref:hypothetical protein n=1 Tax=Streptomyces sp. AC1-42T TaxID=2218665 RepID=UPI000DAD4A70|nr:hypothetical protein [Streptomyces sp. AC1-42T]PZT71407.1 hypothetical protein DNK55_32355 [Streptomyces sp. AC1-42T]
MTRITFLDCEFDPRNMAVSGLLSLGVTDDRGTDYYAVNADADLGAVLDHIFIVEHVLPHMPVTVLRDAKGNPVAIDFDPNHPHYKNVRPAKEIAADLDRYFEAPAAPRLVAYYGAQDACRLHSLWDNDWSRMPTHIPRYFTDIQVMADNLGVQDLPEQESTAHHALADARYNRDAYRFLRSLQEPRHISVEDLARQMHANSLLADENAPYWEALTFKQRDNYRRSAGQLLAQYDIRS